MKRFMNQEHLKYVNCIDVFRLIKEEAQITRKQIEEKTGLSWGAVSNITSRLMSHGFIAEQKTEAVSGPGRPTSYLEVDGSKYGTIGLDVNITGMSAELVNLKGETKKRWNSKTDSDSQEALLNCITGILDQVFSDEETCRYEILGIGAAMQGIVDSARGLSVRFPQCKNWENVPLASLLEEKYKLPVWLEHDPNCILQAYAGNHTIQNTILIRMDRGLGMAVMLDGRILDGTGRFEIAHMIVEQGGAACSCGNKGCLESYASISGLEKLSGLEFQTLAEAAEAGERTAEALFGDMGKKLGTVIYNMRKLFHMSEIILCGELMENSRFFMDAVSQLNTDAVFLTADAGCASYGAAVLALNGAVRNMKI